ncbi:MAG: hypothetical protein IJ410_01520 [Oscillospiraceae bacterium]|nr:hypothetical protein [Oscillospiraceae bacterium]
MNKKRLVALIMVVALALTTLVGGTLAYFTDTDDATNTFVMGNVEIVLDEAKVEYNPEDYTWTADEEAERVDTNTYGGEEGLLYPGAVLPKDPTVHNTGLNDAYIRVKVTMNPYPLGLIMNENSGTSRENFEALVDIDEDNWTYESEVMENVLDPETATWTVTYRYNEIVKAENDTTPLFTTVTIPTDLENMYEFTNVPFDMDILAEAIQAASFADANEAWTAFDAE